MNKKIGVIIVTFNRLNKLKVALKSFGEQTHFPEYLVVVDNASTDGTREYLQEWEKEKHNFKKFVVSMKENRGGSGGFYRGLKKTLNLDADWIWVSDDDAFPALDALENVYRYLENNENNLNNISAVCGQVINHGQTDITHRKIYGTKGLRITEEFVPLTEYKKSEFSLNAFTYVGTIMNKQKLRLAGLPDRGFFIWWDDLEHGLRMSKVGRIICVPMIKVYHDVEEQNDTLNWKTYYGYRNMTTTYRKHFSGPCYWYFCFKVWVKIIFNHLTGNKRQEIRILEEAFADARKRKSGIHSIYKPGWIPEKM